MKKLVTSLLFSACLSSFVLAQDIHLSQFYNSDQLLNPSKTGDFDGDYRITGNYRNQWNTQTLQPLMTSIISFDKGFHYYSHQIDGGILLARDEFDGFNSTTNKILVSAAYGYTYKENRFRVGIQPGFVFKKTDLNKQSFPGQWDFQSGTFNTQLNNQETNLNPTDNYFDLNVGAQWARKFEKIEPKIGFAADHINRPKDTYLNTVTQRLRARKVFHAEANWQLREKIFLQPKLLWMWTAKANDMVLGTNVKHLINNKSITSIYYGAHYRHGVNRIADAVIPTVGLKYKKFDLGFSYDTNVSSISKNVTHKSSFEFSIIYIAASSKPKYITLPCDRY
jgi:type IX secretion system PorP/SprF family membrane protein